MSIVEKLHQSFRMKKNTEGFQKLIAWREAKLLTAKIYRLTKSFPSDERFGLTSQLRRAAGSSMANLAEGSAMRTKAHRDAYYLRARGSVVEVDNHVELSLELQYCNPAQQEDVADHCARLVHLITRLVDAH
jgi:four helix bundle protein